MTEQPLYIQVSTERALSRIGTDEWSQMAWFVKLANTTGFANMTPGERLIWEEDYVAMYLKKLSPLMDIPQDRKRYPKSPESQLIQTVPYLPSGEQMQVVRDAIAPHIEELADDKGTMFGAFRIEITIRFHRNPHYDENPKEPRFVINRGEMSWGETDNIYHRTLVIRAARLLEVYADKVRRCKLCKKLFLQLKRSAQYCGYNCYTVGCMREFRAKHPASPRIKSKKQSSEASGKGGTHHGKKRR